MSHLTGLQNTFNRTYKLIGSAFDRISQSQQAGAPVHGLNANSDAIFPVKSPPSDQTRDPTVQMRSHYRISQYRGAMARGSSLMAYADTDLPTITCHIGLALLLSPPFGFL